MTRDVRFSSDLVYLDHNYFIALCDNAALRSLFPGYVISRNMSISHLAGYIFWTLILPMDVSRLINGGQKVSALNFKLVKYGRRHVFIARKNRF